ncbi:MAG: Metal binding domain of Ada, partial [Candidatus Parcubacteria bacterium]
PAPTAPAPIPLTPATPTEATSTHTAVTGEVVASKTGSKYHLPTCPGAKQIKPENLVSFATASAAQAAGYTPAANCNF